MKKWFCPHIDRYCKGEECIYFENKRKRAIFVQTGMLRMGEFIQGAKIDMCNLSGKILRYEDGEKERIHREYGKIRGLECEK